MSGNTGIETEISVEGKSSYAQFFLRACGL